MANMNELEEKQEAMIAKMAKKVVNETNIKSYSWEMKASN